jgi:hypothetical protein
VRFSNDFVSLQMEMAKLPRAYVLAAATTGTELRLELRLGNLEARDSKVRDGEVVSGSTAIGFSVTRLGSTVRVSLVVPFDLFSFGWCTIGQKVRDWLLRLDEELDKVIGQVVVALIVERSGKSFVTNARSATNAMHVLDDSAVSSRRQIEIDDMHDVLDIQATSSNACGDKNRGLAGTEGDPVTVSLDQIPA